MFTKAKCRQRYDLESLWGIGPEFDEKTQGLDASEPQAAAFSSMGFTQAEWESIVAEVAAEQTSTPDQAGKTNRQTSHRSNCIR